MEAVRPQQISFAGYTNKCKKALLSWYSEGTEHIHVPFGLSLAEVLDERQARKKKNEKLNKEKKNLQIIL